MGIVNGSNMRVYVGTTPIAYATSCSMELSTEVKDRIHKDTTGNSREITASTLSGTVSVEALYSEDTTVNASSRYSSVNIISAWKARTKLFCKVSDATSSNTQYVFYAYITSVSASFAADEDGTVSATLDITGDVTISTVT